MKKGRLITVVISVAVGLAFIIHLTASIARTSYYMSADYNKIKDSTVLAALASTKTVWGVHHLVLAEYAKENGVSNSKIQEIHNEEVAKLLTRTIGHRTTITSIENEHGYKYIYQKDALFQMVLCALYEIKPEELLTMKVKDLYNRQDEFIKRLNSHNY